MKIKTIAIVIIATILSGCSFFAPPRFDNNEYSFFVELETHARFLIEECDDPDKANSRLDAMMLRSETLQTYAYYLPRRSELYGGSDIVNKQIRNINTRFKGDVPPSAGYCRISAKLLVKELRRILTSAGQLQEVFE